MYGNMDMANELTNLAENMVNNNIIHFRYLENLEKST